MDKNTEKLLIINNYMLNNHVITKEEYDKINSEIRLGKYSNEIYIDNLKTASYNISTPASCVS